MTKRLLCLVTDRRRLAAAVGAHTDPIALLIEQLKGAVAGGIDLIQIREPDLEAGTLTRLVAAARAVCRGTATRVVVNERVDVAIAADADGVHLREASPATVDVRRLLATELVGRSVHSREAAIRAGPVDYLIAGTVFETVSKPDRQARLGLDGLAEVVAGVSGVPVLAIGGVSLINARDVLTSGAVGIAAIGLFIPKADQPVAKGVEEIVNNSRFRFDSA